MATKKTETKSPTLSVKTDGHQTTFFVGGAEIEISPGGEGEVLVSLAYGQEHKMFSLPIKGDGEPYHLRWDKKYVVHTNVHNVKVLEDPDGDVRIEWER